MTGQTPITFEIFVQPGFVGMEVAVIVDILRVANRIVGESRFAFHFVSRTAGMIEGAGGIFVRAAALNGNGKGADLLVVVGNRQAAFCPKQ